MAKQEIVENMTELKTGEAIAQQIEKIFIRKRQISKEMSQEVGTYGDHPYTPGRGVGRYGPTYDSLEKELDSLNQVLKKLLGKLAELIE